MDKSEPTLVPEWLKNAGSSNNGGSTYHPDDWAASRNTRNKSFVNGNGHDVGRSSSDMTTSSYFRRSSSGNGSGHVRPYSSFGRNQRDKEWEKDTYDSRDNGKLGSGNRRHQDYSDPPTFSSTFERDGLRRSQSMISGKRDTCQKKPVTELNTASGNNNNGIHVRRSPVNEVKKETFERDFPCLGAEEKVVVQESVRIPSPGLSSAIQNLPIGNSVAINGEKWTSALAEVPVLVGSNGTAQISKPVVSDTTTGLNMAKTVAQGPSRAQTTPQLSVGTQRLEELAIKQSRQLIPVTPALPKTLVVNTSDKHKTKLGQHHLPVSSPLSATHSPRGGPLNGDVSKGMNSGKLHVLKPLGGKNNGVITVVKDTSSPTNGNKVASSTVTSITRGGPPNKPVFDRRPALTVLEKRPTSQAQSRNDFFNQVRKKSMANSPSCPNSAIISDSSVPDKFIETESVLASNTPLSKSQSGDHLSEGSDKMTWNGSDGHHVQDNSQNDATSNGKFSEEEEAAFLRSMGWEENADEDGLTEEEINEFYRDTTKYIKKNPSLNILEGVRSKIGGIAAGVSSGVSSSDAKLES